MEDLSDSAQFRCPTCGARQAPSPECRRCKGDLRVYQAAWRHHLRWKVLALTHLRDGDTADAVDAARLYARDTGSPDAARLLAVTHLIAGQYGKAVGVCRSFHRRPAEAAE